jgi:hypothetical protein
VDRRAPARRDGGGASSPVAKTTGEGDRRAQPGGGGGARPATDVGGKIASAGANGAPWTFWSYLRRRWENDKGLRIDHILLTPDLAARLKAAGVDKPVRGEEGASDHAPTWIDLTD